MRVVTYARVSTLAQESEGQSITNQERAFKHWLERTGHALVRGYREAASAGSVEGRAQFQRMIAELPRTKPDAIVVDTLDRFTRNIRDGLNLMEQLRGHRVGLLAIDWRREQPIDLDDDRDWSDVVDEFTQAEKFRRKLSRTIRRAYEGRVERGATTTNRPAFGLLRVGDRLVPDPERMWIVAKAEEQALARVPYADIARWARSVDPAAWKTRQGVKQCLENPAYLAAGARTEERQRVLDALTKDFATRFGKKKRRHELAYTGIFVCGLCVDGGYAPERSVMHSAVQKGRERVICEHRQNVDNRGHAFYCDVRWIEPAWTAYVERLAQAGAALETWAAGEAPATPNRRALERQLARIDQRTAALADRRDRALDLLGDADEAIRRQVRAALATVDADQAALEAERNVVTGELEAIAAPRRDLATVLVAVERFQKTFGRVTARQRNAASRALVEAVGSRPEIRRIGKGGRASSYEVVLTWPAVDAVIGLGASALPQPS